MNRALSDPILHACSIKRADAEDNITDAEGQSALENENEQGNYCLPLSQTYLTEDTPFSKCRGQGEEERWIFAVGAARNHTGTYIQFILRVGNKPR